MVLGDMVLYVGGNLRQPDANGVTGVQGLAIRVREGRGGRLGRASTLPQDGHGDAPGGGLTLHGHEDTALVPEQARLNQGASASELAGEAVLAHRREADANLVANVDGLAIGVHVGRGGDAPADVVDREEHLIPVVPFELEPARIGDGSSGEVEVAVEGQAGHRGVFLHGALPDVDHVTLLDGLAIAVQGGGLDDRGVLDTVQHDVGIAHVC